MRRLGIRLRRRLAAEEGFGLLELLMTLVILSTAIAALLSVFMGSAFSLARAGHQGTATVIIDRTFEYYRRSPWWDIRLVQHGSGSSGGDADTNVTTDPQYTTQCATCPLGASSARVDESAGTNDSFGTQTTNNTSTCNQGATDPNPDVDSTAPITRCLAITTVRGADGDDYRVYTYMKYGCQTSDYDANHPYALNDYAYLRSSQTYYKSLAGGNQGHTPGSSPLWWTTTGVPSPCPVDYSTKLVTLVVRLLQNGVVQNTTATGILAEQTISFSYQSFVSGYCQSQVCQSAP